MTHVHHIVKDDKCGALRLGFTPKAYLTNGPVPPEEFVEVVAGDLVIEIFDKQDPVCARGQLRLIVWIRRGFMLDFEGSLLVLRETFLREKTPTIFAAVWRVRIKPPKPIKVPRPQAIPTFPNLVSNPTGSRIPSGPRPIGSRPAP